MPKFIIQTRHAEGYFEPKSGGGYQYVYRYADIWGNTRITYADDNGDGMVGTSEIRREQNYYPFGMEHKGYNSAMSGVKNNLKTYQKQEFTEDLGLNTHEWKYRISDPSIGRFWQVDPLAEDYVYNSTYAFQENKTGMGIELEGLELDPWTQTKASTDPNNAKIDKKIYNGAKKMINTSRAMNMLLIDFVFGKGTGLRIWGNGSGSDSTRDDGNSSGETVDTNDIPIIGAGGGSVTSKAGKIAKMADTGLELNEAGTQIGEGVNQIRDIFSKDTTVIAQRAGEIESTTVNSSTQATSTGRIINVEVTVPKSKLDSVDQASSNAEQDLEKKMQQANQNALNSFNNE